MTETRVVLEAAEEVTVAAENNPDREKCDKAR